MLVFYALEARSRWFILAFAGACVLGSIYGFLQGAWPFGLVEAIFGDGVVGGWFIAAGALIGVAFWLYLIAQIIHIRANTEK